MKNQEKKDQMRFETRWDFKKNDLRELQNDMITSCWVLYVLVVKPWSLNPLGCWIQVCSMITCTLSFRDLATTRLDWAETSPRWLSDQRVFSRTPKFSTISAAESREIHQKTPFWDAKKTALPYSYQAERVYILQGRRRLNRSWQMDGPLFKYPKKAPMGFTTFTWVVFLWKNNAPIFCGVTF